MESEFVCLCVRHSGGAFAVSWKRHFRSSSSGTSIKGNLGVLMVFLLRYRLAEFCFVQINRLQVGQSWEGVPMVMPLKSSIFLYMFRIDDFQIIIQRRSVNEFIHFLNKIPSLSWRLMAEIELPCLKKSSCANREIILLNLSLID